MVNLLFLTLLKMNYYKENYLKMLIVKLMLFKKQKKYYLISFLQDDYLSFHFIKQTIKDIVSIMNPKLEIIFSFDLQHINDIY